MPDWFTSPDSSFWLWVDRISITLSYFVVVSVIAFFYTFFEYRRRRKRLAELKGSSTNPQALALCLGGGSIRKAVEDFLVKAYPGVEIPVVEYAAGEITPENIHVHEKSVRDLKHRFQSEAVTELHLFMNGPIGFALAAGAIFDNWVTVKIYQHDRKGNYVAWTTLDSAKSTPVTEALGERILKAMDVQPTLKAPS